MYGLHSRVIHTPRHETLTKVFHLSDLHEGCAAHDGKLLDRAVKRIENEPRGYFTIAGDLTDFERKSTRQMMKAAMAGRPEVLCKDNESAVDRLEHGLVRKFEHIADKCLGIVGGDHLYEFFPTVIAAVCRRWGWDQNEFGGKMNSVQYICKRLNMPYLGSRVGATEMIFRAKTAQSCSYGTLLRHGTGGTGLPGNSINALVKQNARFAKIFSAEVAGHNHSLDIHGAVSMEPNFRKKIWRGRTILCMRAGSMLKSLMPGYETYPESGELGVLPTGFIEQEIITGGTHNGSLVLVEHAATMRMPCYMDY